MAIGTPTQRKSQAFTSQTATTAFSPGTNTASSSAMLFLFAGCNLNKSITSVADSKGNTWTVDSAGDDGTRAVSVASCQVTAQILTSDTITITWSNSSSGSCEVWVQEVTGLAASNALDKHPAANTGSSTSPSSGTTGTLSSTSQIAWALAINGTNSTWTKDAAFTNATTSNLGAGPTAGLEYQIVSANTALNAGATWGTSGSWAMCIATYSATSIGGAPTNSVAPVASGTPRIGSTVSTTDGTWTGSPTFTYQWQRDVLGNASYSNIASATANSYVLGPLDDLCNVRCVVTGTNGSGNASANSNSILDLTIQVLGSFRSFGFR